MREHSNGTKRYLHPVVGDLTVGYESSRSLATRSGKVHRLLANWT